MDSSDTQSARTMTGQIACLNSITIDLLNRCSAQRLETIRIRDAVDGLNLPGITKNVEQCEQNAQLMEQEMSGQCNTLWQISEQLDQIEQTISGMQDSVSQIEIDVLSILSGMRQQEDDAQIEQGDEHQDQSEPEQGGDSEQS